MGDLKFVFLGTGTSQGVPILGCACPVCRSPDPRDKRLRTSAAIFVGEQVWVIDTGPDFRQQALRARLPTVDAVLFTHAHKDHTAGLDDVRPFNYLQNKRIVLYGDHRTLQQIRVEYAYAFEGPPYPGLPQLTLWEIEPFSPFCLHGVEVLPLPFLHYRLPILGYRIGRLAYITDASAIPEETWKYLRGVEILVLNALRKEPHISHFHLDAALEVVAQLKPQEAYFIHISHLMGRHAEVQAELPPGVFLAYDGLELSFPYP
ncbi:MAG: MBL fold metallo-hydrolase [Bacteroidia bacterium]|nr:MBL fold metallo-hydrolase [Bacteroidia bacterium]MDW8235900.1 MBL fold metallo-hydrolase [Bacteroidia bacterium]